MIAAPDAMSEPLGLKVLVVEDEALIALLLEDMLSDLGCEMAATFTSFNDALKGIDAVEADAAVLDVNVAGKEVFPLAEKLRARGIPFVFSTGYGASSLPEAWRKHPIVSKPFDPGALRAGLMTAMSLR